MRCAPWQETQVGDRGEPASRALPCTLSLNCSSCAGWQRPQVEPTLRAATGDSGAWPGRTVCGPWQVKQGNGAASPPRGRRTLAWMLSEGPGATALPGGAPGARCGG